MRRARVGRPHVRLPCALDALQREQELPLTSRDRQFLNGVAISVAATEVHLAVDTRRIAVEHLLDEADAFEELTPVERRNQVEASNQVRHARLFGRLVLAFRPDRVLESLPSPRQRHLELAVQPRRDRPECARALKQARDKRVMDVRSATRRARPARLQRTRPGDRQRVDVCVWRRARLLARADGRAARA